MIVLVMVTSWKFTLLFCMNDISDGGIFTYCQSKDE